MPFYAFLIINALALYLYLESFKNWDQKQVSRQIKTLTAKQWVELGASMEEEEEGLQS